jgi:L-ascorbate metabolism protein UlaG (beta-lactamase superfamily)
MGSRQAGLTLLALVGQACSSGGPESPVLTTITITGAASPVVLGAVATIPLTATALDQNGTPIPATFSWRSSSPATASVDGSGTVTVIAIGSATITAEAQGVSASVTIVVIPPPGAPAVAEVVLDDVRNQGDASDFEVRFGAADPGAGVKEYRVVVVKGPAISRFGLDAANALPPARYLVVSTLSQSVGVSLPVGALDSDGDPIVEGVSYAAFVLAVADGVNTSGNSLSPASNTIAAARTTIKITFVGADGVAITDGVKTVLIDALPFGFSVVINQVTTAWVPAAPGLLDAIQAGSPPYANISALLVTHDHPDHWATSRAAGFLAGHPTAGLIGPSQVAAQVAGNARVTAITPPLLGSAETTVDGVRLRALRMVHFNNFGLDFSQVANLAFLLELGGKKILHLGDADLTSQNLAPFGLKSEQIDVVILPAATIKLTATSIEAVRSLIGAAHLVAAHLETTATEALVKAAWGADVEVFTKSLQFRRY